MQLETILPLAGKKGSDSCGVFAVFCLGLAESLDSGSMSASDAVRFFFHADNCLRVRKMRNKLADEIMRRGVQLPDLFNALPPEEAHREFKHELAAIRELCLRMLEKRRRSVA